MTTSGSHLDRLLYIAGEYWVALDPSYHGGPRMRRFFNPDGSTYSPPDDPFAGYECRCVSVAAAGRLWFTAIMPRRLSG